MSSPSPLSPRGSYIQHLITRGSAAPTAVTLHLSSVALLGNNKTTSHIMRSIEGVFFFPDDRIYDASQYGCSTWPACLPACLPVSLPACLPACLRAG